MTNRNACILFIPDLHEPYGHQDTVPFLTAVKQKYRPSRTILSGDECDYQALKFHPRDPDLFSSGHEHDKAVERLRPLYKLFPEADILESNHTSLAYRQAQASAIPKKWLKTYRQALEAPDGWTWHKYLILTSGKTKIAFAHGIAKNALKVALRRGMCFAEGHFHTRFCVEYAANPEGQILWGLNVGCLIDDRSPAFEYNKLDLERPILGCAVIIEGIPLLIPLFTDKNNRWTGLIP